MNKFIVNTYTCQDPFHFFWVYIGELNETL